MAQELVTRGPDAMPFGEMQVLAEAVAKSQLFGMTTTDQALVLMAISQAEGRHPALAARDYDIIKGKPAKKAEAMLRDFLSAGGKVEWHALSDVIADATFAHPQGGTVRISWDVQRAKQAELAGKDMYRKFPRAMLRSRTVSEGVRTVWPMATSGFYVPEEVADFDRQPAPPIDVTPKADLDTFAAGAQTVEQDESIIRIADEKARLGTAVFKDWWKSLSKATQTRLKPILGRLCATAEDADFSADPADTGGDAAQKHPRPAQQSKQKGEAKIGTAHPADVHSDTPAEEFDEATGEVAPSEQRAEFWSQPKLCVAPVAAAKGNRPDWTRTYEQLLHRIAQAQTADELRRLQADSKRTLDGLKISYVGLHENVLTTIEKRIEAGVGLADGGDADAK